MAVNEEEVRFLAVDFLHYCWRKTGDPKLRKEFEEGLKELGVTEAEFFTKISAFDAARKLSKDRPN